MLSNLQRPGDSEKNKVFYTWIPCAAVSIILVLVALTSGSETCNNHRLSRLLFCECSQNFGREVQSPLRYHFCSSCSQSLSSYTSSTDSRNFGKDPFLIFCAGYFVCKMQPDDIALYSWYRSSCTWRVRIALAWKNIDYQLIPIDLENNKQTDPDFLKLNPKGQVPVLQIDGQTLTQSVAILEYLEETRPEKPLLPKDPKQRADVRQLVETVTAGIQPHQVLTGLFLPEHVPVEWNFARSLDWAGHFIEKGFTGLELLLSRTSGKYSVGDQVTLADVVLVPQVYNAKLRMVDLDPYPNIRRINDELLKLEAFKKAHPSVQPDCVEEYRKIM